MSWEPTPITLSSVSLAIPPRSGDPAYRSPSWSWAWTDVAVMAFKNDLSHEEDLLLAEVKKVEVKSSDPMNLYGQVLDAQLTRTSVLIPVSHSIDAG